MSMSTAAVVEFASPPFGLAPLTSFTLDRIDGAEGLYALRARSEAVRLFVLDVLSGDFGYRPQLTDGIRDLIGAARDSDVRVFVVANPADGGVCVNLRAPIVIHRETGCAAQVILDDQSYPLRAPLVAP